MNPSYFYALAINDCPFEIQDLVTDLCFEHGASGTAEQLAYQQKTLALEPEVLEGRLQNLTVFFSERPPEDLLNALMELAPSARLKVTQEVSKDWLEEWKKGFEAFPLVADAYVVPSWKEIPPEAKTVIRIDPGLAFGTGTHATTKMAAYFVNRVPHHTSFLDVGAGTGILSIFAAKSGFSRVLGVEIDAEARRVFQENVRINEVAAPEMHPGLIEEVHETFDVVVVNIIESVILSMKHILLRRLNPGGHLFLTGILSENEDVFREKFFANLEGFEIVRRLQADEWLGLWLKRTDA